AVTVDALGTSCPQPVIELAKAIGRVRVGGTVTVLADDEVAAVDIPAWCWTQHHAYVGERPADHGVAYVVRRSS
ncbi:sulfurtransferase TusA family protein, partial [Streptomyces silaceus]